MTTFSTKKSATTYRPAILMEAFAKELDSFTRTCQEIGDADFRIRLHQAFEHARGMFVGSGHKLYAAVAKECGVDAATVRDWARGKVRAPAGHRRVILKRVHDHLALRYL